MDGCFPGLPGHRTYQISRAILIRWFWNGRILCCNARDRLCSVIVQVFLERLHQRLHLRQIYWHNCLISTGTNVNMWHVCGILGAYYFTTDTWQKCMNYVLQLVVFWQINTKMLVYIPKWCNGCVTNIYNVTAIYIQWHMSKMFTVIRNQILDLTQLKQ